MDAVARPDRPSVRGQPHRAPVQQGGVRRVAGRRAADLIARAHDRGILWLQTVGDAEAADLALAAGADVLIAQGTEAGGQSGWIGTLVLVPSIVDAAGDVPVIAYGGGHDLLPFTGQSPALVHDVVPGADLIARLLTEAEAAARHAAAVVAA